MIKRIILANPRGFCAGVERAIEVVEKALELYGAPVYVKNEIVHNKYVVEALQAKGAIFVHKIDDIPIGAVTVFSAHGVSQKVEDDSALKELRTIDATCPLVKKVHFEALRNEKQGKQIILIGHAGHPEVEGTAGRLQQDVLLVSTAEDAYRVIVQDPANVAYVTQTTLSVDDTIGIINILKSRFPEISGPDTRDICYATQNRQNAVKKLAAQVDLVLVIGSKNSSNSNRLKDMAEESGAKAVLIDAPEDINRQVLDEAGIIGITAGASAPEVLVENVINFIIGHYGAEVEILDGPVENVQFKLPASLKA
jgi:4-hydroxy-3-methylbut-2-enyl diphosphate reductase